MNQPYSKYSFVDFASIRQDGFRNNVVRLERVPGLVAKCGSYDCYSTYLLCTSDLQRYARRNLSQGRPSVAGYKGPMYSFYLPIDIDCQNDLDFARKSAVAVVAVLQDEIGLGLDALNIYFSGRKGFHLMADARSFQVRPSSHLNLYFARMRRDIADMLGSYGKSIDQNMGDTVRLLRLPNTVNAKSGLYKVQLSEKELESLDMSEITALAGNIRPIFRTDRTGLIPRYAVKPIQSAIDFYERSVERADKEISKSRMREESGRKKIPTGVFAEMCPAKERLYNSRIEQGRRNNAAIILASHFLSEEGRDIENTNSLITEWNSRNSIGLSQAELDNVVRSASRRRYTFGCRALAEYCPFSDQKDCSYLNKINIQTTQS